MSELRDHLLLLGAEWRLLATLEAQRQEVNDPNAVLLTAHLDRIEEHLRRCLERRWAA